MDIYHDRVKIDNFPTFRRRKVEGEILPRLVGINFVQGHIEPVYLPLVKIERMGPLTFVELGLSKPTTIILQDEWPFVQVLDGRIYLEDDE